MQLQMGETVTNPTHLVLSLRSRLGGLPSTTAHDQSTANGYRGESGEHAERGSAGASLGWGLACWGALCVHGR